VPDDVDLNHVELVFQNNAHRLVKDALYMARISATCQYFQQVEGVKMTKQHGASREYLTEDKYSQVSSHLIVYSSVTV
jgi:hypothetical protein